MGTMRCNENLNISLLQGSQKNSLKLGMKVGFGFFNKQYLTCGFFLRNTSLKIMLQHTDVEDVV